MEDALEKLLKAHHTPQPEATLAARITAQATPRPAPRLKLWEALAELLRPAPLAAFACSLMLGVIAGHQLQLSKTASPPPAVPKLSHNAGSFLYYNGEVL